MIHSVAKPLRGLVAGALLALAASGPAQALGERQFVRFALDANAVVLAADGRAARIVVDPHDWPGVRRTAGDLLADIEQVSGLKPVLADGAGGGKEDLVIVCTR
jgi:hypothetical protein